MYRVAISRRRVHVFSSKPESKVAFEMQKYVFDDFALAVNMEKVAGRAKCLGS